LKYLSHSAAETGPDGGVFSAEEAIRGGRMERRVETYALRSDRLNKAPSKTALSLPRDQPIQASSRRLRSLSVGKEGVR
jgi:hypothetical protein